MPDLPPPLSKWKWWERPLTSYEYVRGLKPELTMPPWDVIGCLDIWANVYMKHDPELKEKRDEFLLHWNYVRQRMRGSNLLLRLFEGEAVRRTIPDKAAVLLDQLLGPRPSLRIASLLR